MKKNVLKEYWQTPTRLNYTAIYYKTYMWIEEEEEEEKDRARKGGRGGRKGKRLAIHVKQGKKRKKKFSPSCKRSIQYYIQIIVKVSFYARTSGTRRFKSPPPIIPKRRRCLSLFFSLFRKGAARPRRRTRGFTSRHFSFTATRQVPEIRSLVDALFLFRSYLM